MRLSKTTNWLEPRGLLSYGWARAVAQRVANNACGLSDRFQQELVETHKEGCMDKVC